MKKINSSLSEKAILGQKELSAIKGGDPKYGNCGCACLGDTNPSLGSGTVDNAYANDAQGLVSGGIPADKLIWTLDPVVVYP